jgi:uncharacterized caspase-like protein
MWAWFAACMLALAAHAADRDATVAAARRQPISEPRIALVIGNSDYPNAPLANPMNDARAIAQRLTELRFRVSRIENGTLEQMYEAIRAFGDQLRGGGVGLFYYAGHALQIRGRNFLLPARTVIEREDEILYRTVDTGLVLDKMESARNRVNVMILDACRNNPFGRELRNVMPGLAVVDAPYNTLIAFATAPGAVASDGSGSNGLYTRHLLQSLASPGLGLEDVFKRVRTAVRQESAGRQVPWENTSLEVDFYFDPLPSQTTAAGAGAPDPLTLDLVFWDSIKGSSDPDDYRAYLDRYPQGQFAALARNRLRAGSAGAAVPATVPAAAVAAIARPSLSVPVPGTPAASASPVAVVASAAAVTSPSAPPVAAAASAASPALVPQRALLGHSAEVQAIALTRHGTQALTGAADRSLRQWDLATGRELRRFNGHTAAVTAVAVAADPRVFLSGSADRSVRLWSAASGDELARMMGHGAAVSALAFGPTARYAGSAADDGEVLLWELPGGALIRRARADGSRVRSLAFSPDGRYLLTASEDGGARLWEVGSLRVVRSFGPLAAPALAAAFSSDGRRVVAIDGHGEIATWETQSGAPVQRFATEGPAPALAAVAPDASAVLAATAVGDLVAWDIGNGRAVWRANTAQRRITGLAIGPRGSPGLSAGDDQRLLLWTSAP